MTDLPALADPKIIHERLRLIFPEGIADRQYVIREMAARTPERVIEVEWGSTKAGESAVYPVDVAIEAADRQGLLRDISEAISRERINVTAVNTLSRNAHAYMRFTLQVSSADGIQRVIRQVKDVPGVDSARRL